MSFLWWNYQTDHIENGHSNYTNYTECSTLSFKTLHHFTFQNITPFHFSKHYTISLFKTLHHFTFQNITPFHFSKHYTISLFKTLHHFTFQNITPFHFSKHYTISLFKTLHHFTFQNITPFHFSNHFLFWKGFKNAISPFAFRNIIYWNNFKIQYPITLIELFWKCNICSIPCHLTLHPSSVKLQKNR